MRTLRCINRQELPDTRLTDMSSTTSPDTSQDSAISYPPPPTFELLYPDALHYADPLHPSNNITYVPPPNKNHRVAQPRHMHLPSWKPPWIEAVGTQASTSTTNKMSIINPRNTFLKDDYVVDNVYNSSLNNNNDWKCVECLKVFYMKNRLKLHYLLEHKVPYCHLCDLFMEKGEEELGHHQRIHEGKTCDFCYLLVSDTDLSEHHRLEHDVVSCPCCLAYIRPSSELGGHLTYTHRFKVDPDDPDCQKLFEQTGNGRESFRCFLCGQNRKRELTGHFNIYHKVHTQILADLFVKYKVDLTLLIEGTPDSGPLKNVTCEVCDEKIPELIPTEFHFVYCRYQACCSHCSAIFPTEDTLRSHNDFVHERHPCKLDCTNMAYNSAANLSKHYLAYHNREVCEFCDEMVAAGEVEEEGSVSEMVKHVKMAHACVGTFVGKLVELSMDDDSSASQLFCLLCLDVIQSTSPNEVYLHFNRDHSVASYKLLSLIRGNLLTKSSTVDESTTLTTNEAEIAEDNNSQEVIQDVTDESFPTIFDEKLVECLFEFNEIIGDVETKCELCPEEFCSTMQYISHLYSFHNLTLAKKYLKCDECFLKKNRIDGLLLKHFKHYIEVENHREEDKNFNCNLCDTEIWLLDAYEHYRSQHKKEKDERNLKKHGYKCRFCAQIMWSAQRRNVHEIKNHYADEENKGKFYACQVCEKVFATPVLFREHAATCSATEKYSSPIIYHCLKCSLVFPTAAETTKHFERYHEENVRFQCVSQLCNGSFKERRTAKRHYFTVHVIKKQKESIKKNAQYLCKVCGEAFATKSGMSGHNRVHSTQKRFFKCVVCEEKFMTKAIKTSHMQTVHVGLKMYKCTECDQMFKSKTACTMHKSTHLPNFSCSYCQKEFSRRDSFKEHLLIHEGPRHQCPHCPRAFTQMSNLRRHLRIHTGEKPYKCAFCDKSFSDIGACKSHTSVHTREQECKCEICGKSYSKKQKLRYHMKTHTREDMHPCHICHKEFVGRYALRVHLGTHEGGGRASTYMCDLCNKEWKTKRALTRHRQTCKGIVIRIRKKYKKREYKQPREKKEATKKKKKKSKNPDDDEDEDEAYVPESHLLKTYELRQSNKAKNLSETDWDAQFPTEMEYYEDNNTKKEDVLDISEIMVSTMETSENNADPKDDEDSISIIKLKSALANKISTFPDIDYPPAKIYPVYNPRVCMPTVEEDIHPPNTDIIKTEVLTRLMQTRVEENIVKSEENKIQQQYFVDVKLELKEEQMSNESD